MPEQECAIKDSEPGAAERAPFIKRHIIAVAFDNLAASGVDQATNRTLSGI